MVVRFMVRVNGVLIIKCQLQISFFEVDTSFRAVLTGDTSRRACLNFLDVFARLGQPLMKASSVLVDIGSGLGLPLLTLSHFCRACIGFESVQNRHHVSDRCSDIAVLMIDPKRYLLFSLDCPA